MIIFGTRAGKLKNPQTTAYDCYYCNSEKSVWFYFYQKYIHIFWIPFIPIGKTGVSVCGHCKQTLEEKQMPENKRIQLVDIKKQLKTPFGYKILLFLILAIILVPFIIGFAQKIGQ